MNTPALDKMLKVRPKSQALGAFLEWLMHDKKVVFAYYVDEDVLLPIMPFDIQKVLAEYFDIDLAAVEKERGAILESLQ